jgi:hypothetical protein
MVSHCVLLGVHIPQDPPEHTIVEHSEGAFHWPLESHVCW